MIEPSFNPRELKASLSDKRKVHIDIVQAGHGFADPYSKRYQEGIAKEVIAKFYQSVEKQVQTLSLRGDNSAGKRAKANG